ncbi:hypothetical protein BXO88_03575 [Oribacterium sp. C9]|uniref:hypothetical protein n=1 Tax=Oribacterium sp. C9 TaxID=1943579 RepID=UPI00098F08BE|nr:hypothetical protein [Oribacterium sp. C9]OON87366.1 hypothetical protein BXO88_03575 [Oribacterium sp. C9]
MDKKNIFKKLNSSRGETITEVLVSTLIAVLAMIMFASMVVASKNIIENGRDTIKNYYIWISKMVIKDGVKIENGTLKFDDTALVYDKKSYDVKVYENQPSESNGITHSMIIKRYE